MSAILNALVTPVLPVMLDLAGIVLAGVVGRAALVAHRRWGIEIEARHREALHSALMSGIRAALAQGLTGGDAVSAAVGYAVQSVPDAIVKLDPAADVLMSLARAKLREAAG